LDVNVKVIARATGILAKETLLIGFVNCSLELDLLIPEFSTNINICSLSSHTETDNQCSLDELVRVMSQYFSILACPGL
jgi:hypothetical protein